MSEDIVENQIKEVNTMSGDLMTNLKEIFETGMPTYAHGTRIEAAQEIISEGLKSKSPDLCDTTVPLFDHEKPFEEQIDAVIKMIEKWPHLKSRAIIIIMLPVVKKTPMNPELGMASQCMSTQFFHEIPGEDEIYGLPYLLPPNYIKGFVDAETKEFIKNPQFNPTPPKPGVNQSREQSNSKAPAMSTTNKALPIDLLP